MIKVSKSRRAYRTVDGADVYLTPTQTWRCCQHYMRFWYADYCADVSKITDAQIAEAAIDLGINQSAKSVGWFAANNITNTKGKTI